MCDDVFEKECAFRRVCAESLQSAIVALRCWGQRVSISSSANIRLETYQYLPYKHLGSLLRYLGGSTRVFAEASCTSDAPTARLQGTVDDRRQMYEGADRDKGFVGWVTVPVPLYYGSLNGMRKARVGNRSFYRKDSDGVSTLPCSKSTKFRSSSSCLALWLDRSRGFGVSDDW